MHVVQFLFCIIKKNCDRLKKIKSEQLLTCYNWYTGLDDGCLEMYPVAVTPHISTQRFPR